MSKFLKYVLFLVCFLSVGDGLYAASNIVGRITDAETGEVINGATVELTRGGNVKYTDVTDFLGLYGFFGIQPSPYDMVVTAPGYRQEIIGVDPDNNETEVVNVELIPVGSTIQGTVRDADTTNPIAGATVTAFDGPTFISSTTTNGSGDYDFGDIFSAGTYTITATASTYQTDSQGVILLPNSIKVVDFDLEPTPGEISGTVTDCITTDPLENVTVTVIDGETNVGSSTTNASGQYTVPDLAPGSYSVRFELTDYQTKVSVAVVITALTTTVDACLDPSTGAISGQVTDSASSDPIPGASVVLRRGLDVVSSGVSDSSGNYSLVDLAPGNYTLTTSHPDYQTKVIGVNVVSNTTVTGDIELDPDFGSIAGQITDDMTTDPIVGATVRVYDGASVIASAVTDDNGVYIITKIGEGNYTVQASAVGYQTKQVGALVEDGEVTTVDIALPINPGAIDGQITDADTTDPIPGAIVGVTQGQVVVATVITDDMGNYILTGLAPGEYELRVQANDYQVAIVGASVTGGSTTTVDVALDPLPGSIQGVVTDDETGDPISGATVNVYFGSFLVASRLTDSVGSYLVGSLPPGNYTLTAIAKDYQSSSQGVFVFTGISTIANFSLEPLPGSLSGTVEDANTTDPIPGALVIALKDQVLLGASLTDANGKYAISDLAEGNYSVLVFADGYQRGLEGAIVESEENTVVNFSLETDRGEIVGTVTDANTTDPIPGAQVEVYNGTTLVDSALTDSSGNYVVQDLPPGFYNVRASATGYQAKTLGATVTNGGTTVVDFALDPSPGSVAGMVTDADDGTPIQGAVVHVFSAGNLAGITMTNAMGNYRVTGLAPGSYTVVVSADDYQTASTGVNVVANVDSTANFQLDPFPGTVSGTVTDADTTDPIPGAVVLAYNGQVIRGSSITDANGNYTITGLDPGSYTMIAIAAGYERGLQGAIVNSGVTTTVNFALNTQPGDILGTVEEEGSGDPIEGATVEVFQGTTLVGSATTDPSGNYIINDLSPGSYNVTSSAEGYQTKTEGATVLANTQTTVDFELAEDPGTISGLVTDDSTGEPIPGAAVLVFRGLTLVSFVLSDDNGEYNVTGLAPGFYILRGSKGGYSPDFIGAFVQSNMNTIANLDLAPFTGGISGTVTDSVTTNPIPSALVRVRKGPLIIAETFTDPQGNYQFEDLDIDTYDVTASAATYSPETRAVSVIANQVENADFTLDPNPGSISGTVTSSGGGNPLIPDASIFVYQGLQLVAQTTTDVNGDYAVPDLNPGNYTVVVSADGFQTEFALVVVSSGMNTIADFEMDEGIGTISGRVIDRCTGGPAEALILVKDGVTIVGFAVTDENGLYTVEGLPPGNYTVCAISSLYQIEFKQAIVVGGSDTLVNFLLTPKALPPTDISGEAFNNQSLTKIDRVHVIRWEESNGLCVTEYRVYRNGELIAVVSADGPLEYWDHCRNGKTDTYTVRAVNQFGDVSSSVSITLK